MSRNRPLSLSLACLFPFSSTPCYKLHPLLNFTKNSSFSSSIQHPTQIPNPTFILKTCISLLQVCTSKHKLKQIHGFSIRNGVLPTNSELGKHLIFTIVSLSETMDYAVIIFTQLQNPNIFIWNTMIRGFAESENPKPATQIYQQMHVSAIEPDTHTYPFLLKAIGKLMDVREGEKIHCQTIKNGFETLVFVQNALVHVYACCGLAESAHQVFDQMSLRNLVTWNSVINGFAQNGRPNEALTLYRQMRMEGVKPDGFTMVSLLSACAEIGALALGRRVHVYVLKIGLCGNLHLGNALIDLYAKCGSITESYKVFDEMPERSVVSWTSLIVGLAINGFAEEALELFVELESERLRPSEITFVGVLYACSHCGLVEKGFGYFKSMSEDYGIIPKIEHYGCMVDLLGRAGLVEEAYDFIKTMPLEPNAVIWRTLLGACAIHGHLNLGKISITHLVRLDPHHSGDYVLISNLYAAEGLWSDVQMVRRTMLRQGVKKSPGHSLVELGNSVHEFIMGDRSHPQTKEIYEMLEEITKKLKLQGYVPSISNVLADIEEEEKEKALCYHSEKLAIAFMLINTAPGTPIRVVKNLRVCGDCHSATKLIAKIFDREIIVRDRSRFHHFRDGFCSCNDYW